MDTSRALIAISALAQETRLDAFRLLVRAGCNGLPAGEIAARLNVRQNTMSSHLAILARAGIISRLRDGRVIRYSADFGAMRSLMDFMLEQCCEGPATVRAPAQKPRARSR